MSETKCPACRRLEELKRPYTLEEISAAVGGTIKACIEGKAGAMTPRFDAERASEVLGYFLGRLVEPP